MHDIGASLETCQLPHAGVVAAAVVVAFVVDTVTSTLGQSSWSKKSMQHSSPVSNHPLQFDVGSCVPTPLLVQVPGASLETCHFPHSPELCVTIPSVVVVVAAATVVVVVVVAATGCEVGVLVGLCEGKGVG